MSGVPPDYVMLDYRMTVRSASFFFAQVAEAYSIETIRKAFPVLLVLRQFDSDTPIIFYSGDGDQSHKDEAFQAGAQDYIVKPASCEDVVSTILAAVKRSGKIRASASE